MSRVDLNEFDENFVHLILIKLLKRPPDFVKSIIS